jgi:hypothetical protein
MSHYPMKQILWSLVIACAAISLLPNAASACRNPVPKTTLQNYSKGSKAIFVGKVMQITALPEDPNKFNQYAVQFQVSRSWKGVDSPQISVIVDDASCGGLKRSMQPGDRWLIFASGEPLQADGFNQHTRSVKNPAKDLRDIVKVFGNGKTMR